GPASGHAWSRFLRTTAVSRNLPATWRASAGTFLSSLTCSTFCAGGVLAGGAVLLFVLPLVLGTSTTIAVTTPTMSTRPATQGNQRWNLREFMTASNVDIVVSVDGFLAVGGRRFC